MQRSHPSPRWTRNKFLRGTWLMLGLGLALSGSFALGQGTAGSISGTVADASGALIPGAVVVIANPVSGYTRTVKADAGGNFQFLNVPFNPYGLTVTEAGFQKFSQTVQVSSPVAVALKVALQVAASETVTVTAPVDLVENDSTAHTDIDRSTIDHLPLESASSALSSIVTLSSPGVSADSNGQMHGLGDHAENSFNIDGQPITDQQSKVFSNQVPSA